MSDHPITSLIEKLEGAEVGSRELDSLVERAVGLAVALDGHGRARAGDGTRYRVPAYSTSLDAALALAERVLPGWTWEITLDGCGSVQGAPEMWPEGLAAPDRDGVYVTAQTSALALCAAVLRAQSEARV